MTIPPSTLAIHERRFQAVVVGGLVTVFAIVALTPHTERALFEEGRLPAAFAAVAISPVTPLLRRFGVMEPESFARAFRTGRPQGVPPVSQSRLPGLIPPAVAQPPALFAPPADSTPGLVADSGILDPQGRVPGLQNASFTPGPGSGIIGTGVGPGPGGSPGPTDPTDPTTNLPPVVSPIPEPASWSMLLIGLALVGFITRRTRKRMAAAV